MTTAELREPKVGELYVKTDIDRVFVVEGIEGLHGRDARWRRVLICYLDNGRRTKIHLYRFEDNWDGRQSFARCIRVRPDVRVKRLKRARNGKVMKPRANLPL